MNIIDAVQGSAEWAAHRAGCWNASDLPAVRGVSKHKTRTQFLDSITTGIESEIDPATQKRFNDGHRFEALARVLAEKIICQELFPVVASMEVGLSRPLGASLDGLTMDGSINFEHKTLNNDLRAIVDGSFMPEMIMAQMDQQHMVSGCDKTLFMASVWDDQDNLIEERHCWYVPSKGYRERVLNSWQQFEKDLETHTVKAIIEKPAAEATINLPALFVTAVGQITAHNMGAFGAALTERLAEVRSIVLIDDQDFSNAKAHAKKFREVAKAIAAEKERMLSQTDTIGESSRKMDVWVKDLNTTALQLEKDVEREDATKKRGMISEAVIDFAAHVEDMESTIRPIRLSVPRPDFSLSIKGKSKYSSMQNAINEMLAKSKVDVTMAAKDIRYKLAWYDDNNGDLGMLFPDLAQIITKPADDFQLLVDSRVVKHKLAEIAKLEAERQRIRQEEEAMARMKADAQKIEDDKRLEAERIKIREEESAKFKAKFEAERECIIIEDAAKLKAESENIDLAKAKHAEDDLQRRLEIKRVISAEKAAPIIHVAHAQNPTITEVETSPAERVDAALDSILKASGSALKNYTMPMTLDRMREAMRNIMSASYIAGSNDNFRVMKDGIEK